MNGRRAATLGGPRSVSSAILLGLWPIEVALQLLVAGCVAYGSLYIAGMAIPAGHGPLALSPNLTLDVFANFLAHVREIIGHAITFGTSGTPSLTGTVLNGAIALGSERSIRTITRPRRSPAVGGPSAAPPLPRTAAITTGHTADQDTERKQRRIAGVTAALTDLDAEWLAYEQDLEAYYLTKPILRDVNVPETAAYRAALYDLREHARALTDSATAQQISAAEHAAETALLTWGAANDHALLIGVSDRSPAERAALRRLHGLLGQLADPSTPKPMWSSIAEAITREMAKLTTVPTSWNHVQNLPALEHRNFSAITDRNNEGRRGNRAQG
jgi:hypothetical protein